MKSLLFLLLVGSLSWANIIVKDNGFEVSGNQLKVKELIQKYAKYKNQNLAFTDGFNGGKMFVYGETFIPNEDLDRFVSKATHSAGYTLLFRKDLIQVINARDVRYAAAPMYTDIKKVPKTYNYVQFTFSTKHVPTKEISRNLRPFMGRYGRIVDESNGQAFIISDTALNVRRVYEIIQKLDTAEFEQSRKDLIQFNKKVDPKLVYEDSFVDIIADQNVLFIVLFSILSLIIGFGLRGYLMKRVEGGW